MAVGNMLGGGVIVLLAAALWLLYLVPGWVKRREYMATERNAVRLQQTIRTLAETAETPEEVFVELDARTVAAQQKILRRGQRARKAEVRAAAKEQLVAEQTERAQARLREQAQKREQEQERMREEAAAEAEARAWEEAERRASAASRQARIDHEVSQAREGRGRSIAGSAATSTRIPSTARPHTAASVSVTPSLAQGRRRGRLFGTSVGFVGLVLGIIGLLLGGLGIVVAVIGAILLLGGATVLVQIARKATAGARVQSVTPPARTTRSDVPDYRVHDEAGLEDVAGKETSAEWTPRPLPRPLHLSRGTIAQSTMASINAASELREATQRAELDERAERIVAARAAADSALGRAATQSPVVQGSAARVIGVRGAAAGAPAGGASTNRGADTQTAANQRTSAAVDQRYAAMGIVDEAGSGNFNLEEAMRRRRAS